MHVTACVQLMDWDDELDTPNYNSIDEETECSIESDVDDISVSPTPKRGRKNIMTSRLAAALDNAKISDGMATHILVAAAEALGHRVEELIINRSTIHNFRMKNRIKESKEIANDFNDNVI